MTRVTDIGEFQLIARLHKQLGTAPAPDRSVVCGIGDDCAVLRTSAPRNLLLYTCDPVVEGVHYELGTPARQVGWKVMARNLSDIAAMGGVPRWAVVSVGLRPNTPVKYVEQLYTGIRAAGRKFGCAIVGGDTTHVRHEQFAVVSLIGEVERSRLVLRSGAKPGDFLFITGTLGGSLRGKHLTFTPRVAEARWLVNHFPIHAMIDLSDGLSCDLQRLVEANRRRVGFEINASAIPVARAAAGRLEAALHDGEDFELLIAVSPRIAGRLQSRWRRKFSLPLTRIGQVIRAPGNVQLISETGTRRLLKPRGYDHFANR